MRLGDQVKLPSITPSFTTRPMLIWQALTSRVLSCHLTKPNTTRVSSRWESRYLTAVDQMYAASDASASLLIYTTIQESRVPALAPRPVVGRVDTSTQSQANHLTDDLLRHVEDTLRHVDSDGIEAVCERISPCCQVCFVVVCNRLLSNDVVFTKPKTLNPKSTCSLII